MFDIFDTMPSIDVEKLVRCYLVVHDFGTENGYTCMDFAYIGMFLTLVGLTIHPKLMDADVLVGMMTLLMAKVTAKSTTNEIVKVFNKYDTAFDAQNVDFLLETLQDCFINKKDKLHE